MFLTIRQQHLISASPSGEPSSMDARTIMWRWQYSVARRHGPRRSQWRPTSLWTRPSFTARLDSLAGRSLRDSRSAIELESPSRATDHSSCTQTTGGVPFPSGANSSPKPGTGGTINDVISLTETHRHMYFITVTPVTVTVLVNHMLQKSVIVSKYLLTMTLFHCLEGFTVTEDVCNMYL